MHYGKMCYIEFVFFISLLSLPHYENQNEMLVHYGNERTITPLLHKTSKQISNIHSSIPVLYYD